MISKEELIKLLSVALQDKYELDGQIKLLNDQLRMIALKEEKIENEAILERAKQEQLKKEAKPVQKGEIKQ